MKIICSLLLKKKVTHIIKNYNCQYQINNVSKLSGNVQNYFL